MHKWANNNIEISKIQVLYEFSSKTANMLTDKESNLEIKSYWSNYVKFWWKN